MKISSSSRLFLGTVLYSPFSRLVRVMSSEITTTPLLIHSRQWMERENACAVKHDNRFRIMQWNHLADGLAQHGKFLVDDPLLVWEFRWPKIQDEIRAVNPDIICLQEANYPNELAVKFPNFAMFSVPKLFSAALREGYPPDGVAIYVNRDRFTVTDVRIVYYKEEDKRMSNQNAIILLLKDNRTGNDFILASTHLKAKSDPAAEATRSIQANQLLQTLNKISLDGAIPIILAGDFNSKPQQSAYSQIMASPLRFTSAYNSLDPESGRDMYESGEPSFTTWKFRSNEEEKKACIDYIFFTNPTCVSASVCSPSMRLRNVAILALPTEEEIGPKALPSPFFPSDHLSLAADFEFWG